MKAFRVSVVYFLYLALLLTPTFSWALGRQSAFVEEVLTGDTIRLKGGKILKYTGLEAPPLQHLLPLVRVYGENSKNFNKDLVLGKKVWIQWGKRLKNSQNHLLGYVYLEDGTFVNLEILKLGHAKPRLIAPDTDFSDEFRQASLSAQRQYLGVWKEAPKNPFLKEEYLGEKNTKIFYLPNSPELERIPQAQLVPFRSRVSAIAAGYKACSTCKETSQLGESESLY